jgi:sec-independent protein translocase protein TatC
MRQRIKPVAHEAQLSIVDHLDELRWRLISVLVVFGIALAVAFWQNNWLLDIVNRPLPNDLSPATFGVSEAFISTLTVCMYAALIATLPLLIYHLYAFVMPAFSPEDQSAARPLLALAPVLFAAGVAFSYLIVLPAATGFLLNFNDDQFAVQVRAREYYSFFGLMLVSIGLLFEMPLGILIATKLGVVTPEQLRKNRRYAILVLAIVAMLLPGTDPISMLIELVPLVLLYELSIVLATLSQRAERRREAAADSSSGDPSPGADASMG